MLTRLILTSIDQMITLSKNIFSSDNNQPPTVQAKSATLSRCAFPSQPILRTITPNASAAPLCPRRSAREKQPRRVSLWKKGDGDGKKEDPHPKLYDEPPHKIAEGDEDSYPPKYVNLSLIWVYQVVRYLVISQEVRYQRWPMVFPSKDPLRHSWANTGLALRVGSDVCQVWVHPVIFNKYQLHGEEGTKTFDINQSALVGSTRTNATHDILEGAKIPSDNASGVVL